MLRRYNISLLSSVSRGSSIQPLCFLPTSNFHTIKGGPPTRGTYISWARGVFFRPPAPSCLRRYQRGMIEKKRWTSKGDILWITTLAASSVRSRFCRQRGDEPNTNKLMPKLHGQAALLLNCNCVSERVVMINKLRNKAFAFNATQK